MKIWPFNRTKQAENEALPEEVKQYYESGRKQKSGMAWLLAFATLVVTVLLALLIFFGGRWIYQQLTKDDQPATPVEQQPAEQQVPAEPAQPEATNDNPEPQDNSSTHTTTPNTSTGNGTATPNTGESVTEVPNTGPGPDGLQ